MKFKNIPNDEKPRERLFLYGSENLSNEELLSIILKTGTKKYSVKEVASNLISKIGNIKNLKDIGLNTLMDIEGIGKVKAIELRGIFGTRLLEDRIGNLGPARGVVIAQGEAAVGIGALPEVGVAVILVFLRTVGRGVGIISRKDGSVIDRMVLKDDPAG